MEIERKWRMSAPPPLRERSHTRIEQSYLCVTPEVRIRRYEDVISGSVRYDLTIKGEGTLSREEIIKDLSAEEYGALLGLTHGAEPIVKDLRTYDYEGRTLEFSYVDPQRASGFSYAEVEFPSEEEARAFLAPEWFGQESTEDGTFRMKLYWQETRN